MEWNMDFSLTSVFASPWSGFLILLAGLLSLAMLSTMTVCCYIPRCPDALHNIPAVYYLIRFDNVDGGWLASDLRVIIPLPHSRRSFLFSFYTSISSTTPWHWFLYVSSIRNTYNFSVICLRVEGTRSVFCYRGSFPICDINSRFITKEPNGAL
jgi:hypothetical protein